MRKISSCTSVWSAAARTATGRPSNTSPRRCADPRAGREISAAGSSTANVSRRNTRPRFPTSAGRGARASRLPAAAAVVAALVALHAAVAATPRAQAAHPARRADRRADQRASCSRATPPAWSMPAGSGARARSPTCATPPRPAGGSRRSSPSGGCGARAPARGCATRCAAARATAPRTARCSAPRSARSGRSPRCRSRWSAIASASTPGVTDERLPQWFLDYAMRIGLDALLGALIVAGVLALVERVRAVVPLSRAGACTPARSPASRSRRCCRSGRRTRPRRTRSRRSARRSRAARRPRHAGRPAGDVAPQQRDDRARSRDRSDRARACSAT